MKVSDEKWDQIIRVTRAVIDKLNARARARQLSDKFHVNVQRTGAFELLLTEHIDGTTSDRRIAVRQIETGEVRPIKLKNSRGAAFVKTKSVPKACAGLADRPAAVIVRALKLVDTPV